MAYILIGLALGWWFGDYVSTDFLLGATLMAFVASFLIGRAIKLDEEQRRDRDD